MSSRTFGLTYFVQAEHGGPIKIGRTDHHVSDRRLSSLQTGNPYRLVVRNELPGTHHEGNLHHAFRAFRLMGEWFSPTPEIAGVANGIVGDVQPRAELDLAFGHGFKEGYERAYEQMADRVPALFAEATKAHLKDQLDDVEYFAEDALLSRTAHANAHVAGIAIEKPCSETA